MRAPEQIGETVAGWCVATWMPVTLDHAHRDEYDGAYRIFELRGPYKSRDDADTEAARCDAQTTYWRYQVVWAATTITAGDV